MTTLVKWLGDILTGKLGMSQGFANILDDAIVIIVLTAFCIGLNWLLQSIFRWISERSNKFKKSKWHAILVRRKLAHHALLLIPGIFFYILVWIGFGRNNEMVRVLHRIDVVYLIIVVIMICNALLSTALDIYNKTDKHKTHPLQGVVQALKVVIYFVGGIIIVAVVIDKSPVVLLTGLGASAAVLMLIFKDSILGFVAGVQLAQNNMVRLGDWIQMPDGTANGTVEEITLNTVKVRNWDNTLTMIPPYTLVSTPFKNWRGMQESGGRRADKCIYIDMTSLEICTDETLEKVRQEFPIMADRLSVLETKEFTTNVQLYRAYIETYLRQHPDVNADLDIIVTQKEATAYGLPIEVYFFTRIKTWAIYERQQSDIFDHLMTMASEFGLRIYQRP